MSRIAVAPGMQVAAGQVIGYVGSFVTWMTLLKHAPVGPAFAASHLEVVTVLIISVLAFDEKLTLMQLLGGASIVLGIDQHDTALLALTFGVSLVTFVGGRTNILPGFVHLVLFAIFVFMIFVP